jgi:membrane protein YqaA with SNARE-associated domain
VIRPLYNWVMRQAESRHAPKALFVVSFAESSFFPIPPDVMLAPMVVKRPEKAYWFAFVCTLASVLGGILGYAIGYFLTDFGQWILAVTGNKGGLAEFQAWYADWGIWLILAKGLTPIPYKLVTIASGIAHFSFGMFMLGSVVTRGARFFAVAWALKKFGPHILPVIERRLTTFTIIGLIVLVGGVLALKFLH